MTLRELSHVYPGQSFAILALSILFTAMRVLRDTKILLNRG